MAHNHGPFAKNRGQQQHKKQVGRLGRYLTQCIDAGFTLEQIQAGQMTMSPIVVEIGGDPGDANEKVEDQAQAAVNIFIGSLGKQRPLTTREQKQAEKKKAGCREDAA